MIPLAPILLASLRAPVPLLLLCWALLQAQPVSADGDSSSSVVPPGVHWSADHRYAFPLAGPLDWMGWTHYHWDGRNPVDIMARPSLPSGSPIRAEFAELPAVAVISGRAVPAQNELGGIALILQGNDGRQYYYAHLRTSWVTGPTQVAAGEELGVVGRTGRWTRYIETHLHFAVASSWHAGLEYTNDVNAADWILKTFGVRWEASSVSSYPADSPHGSPFRVPYVVGRTFAQNARLSPDLASVDLRPESPTIFVPVLSTMTGEVRVMKNTVLGLRIQITNRPNGQTIVFSGLAALSPDLGSVASAGQVIGYAAGEINYMYFDHGKLTDPTTVMGSGGAPSLP